MKNDLHPLFRLFWRPGILLDLVVTGVFAIMLSWIGGGVGMALFQQDGSLFGIMSPTEYRLSPGAQNLHVCLLVGAVLGTVANFAMQDLLYCRFSWGLPKLEKQLRTGLWWLAALTVAIGAIAGGLLGALGHGPGPIQGGALGLLGFALGTMLWDPKIGRGICFGAQFSLVTAVLAADPLARGIGNLFWPAPLVSLLLVFFSIHRATRRDRLRRRALVPKQELGASFRYADPVPPPPEASRSVAARRPWSEGHVLNLHGWIRALHYENAGWVRGAWKGRVARIAVAMVLLAGVANFALGLYQGGVAHASWEAIVWSVFDAYRPALALTRLLTMFVAHATALAAIILVLSNRLDLRRGVSYPISRPERAEIVWRSCLHQGLALLLLTGVLFGLMGLATAWLTGVEVTLHRVPDVVIATALAALGLPLLQAARLSFVDTGRVGLNSVAFGASVGTLGMLFLASHGVAFGALVHPDPDGAGVVLLAVLMGLWIIVQLGFRHWLRSWFATTDLA